MKTNLWQILVLRAPAAEVADPGETGAILLADLEPCGIEERLTDGGTVEWHAWFDAGTLPADFAETIRFRAAAAGISSLDVEGPSDVPRENWHDGWRDYFVPVDVTPRLRIAPPWRGGENSSDGKIEIIIEPGMAFGTGTHATTQLCLGILDRLLPAGARVLDAGTGSAILAIAAAKLGAAHVVAIDNDPDILDNAHDNLRLNGVTDDKVEVVVGPLSDVPAGSMDFAICNMLSAEFLPLLADLRRACRDGATLVLSGLLTTEHPAVDAALRVAGFEPSSAETMDEWTAVVARAL